MGEKMVKSQLMALFVLGIMIFLPLQARAQQGSTFRVFLKDMHKQIVKWKGELEEIEKNPDLSLAERSVVQTLIKLLDRLEGVIKKFLPKEPKIEKTQNFTQRCPRYALHVPFLGRAGVG
jgi:hypothetical protein